MVRESTRCSVNAPCPRRTGQRALASSRTSVADAARATTARMALEPASSAAITRGAESSGMEKILRRVSETEEARRKREPQMLCGSDGPPRTAANGSDSAWRYRSADTAYHHGQNAK